MDRYAVIGNPVAHSKSPLIHAAFAEQTGERLSYAALLAPLDGFANVVSEFAGSGGKGLNITVPFKLDAVRFSSRLSERAAVAGAVNTLSFDANGAVGDNTDGIGLVRDLLHNLGFPIVDRCILLIGAGGAARGVMLALLAEKPAGLTIANRTAVRASELALRFSAYGKVDAASLDALAHRRFDLVINATAASLGNKALRIPAALFKDGVLAYDMMYGKNPPPFLNLAKEAGAQTADGLGMLVEQAAESFLIWRGVRPDTRPVLQRLRGAV